MGRAGCEKVPYVTLCKDSRNFLGDLAFDLDSLRRVGMANYEAFFFIFF